LVPTVNAFAADQCIPREKMNALDRGYTAVVQALGDLVQAVGLKLPKKQAHYENKILVRDPIMGLIVLVQR